MGGGGAFGHFTDLGGRGFGHFADLGKRAWQERGGGGVFAGGGTPMHTMLKDSRC